MEGQLITWFMLVFFMSLVFRGNRLYRMVGATFFWQMLSPVRPAIIEVPLLISFLVIVEALYCWVTR